MAGTIIADYIRADANQLSLNVGNTTFATINASGFFSNTGTQLIAANGKVSGASVIASSIPTAAIADSAITRAKMGYAGAILQVVSNTTKTTYSFAGGTTFTASGFTTSITPTSSSSKILVLLNGGQWRYSPSGGNEAWMSMYRSIASGSYSAINSGAGIDEILISPAASTMAIAHSYCYLDSPATTSSVTYQPYVKNNSGSATVYFNLADVYVTMTLIEVAA